MLIRNSLILILTISSCFGQIFRPNNLFKPLGGGGTPPGAFVAVSTNVNVDTSATTHSTFTVNATSVAAGNLAVVMCKWEGGSTTTSVSDGTTTLTAGTAIDHGTADLHSRMFYIPSSVASGTVTYTITFGAARKFLSMHVWVYSYTGTAVLDVEPTGGGGTGTSQALSSGNFTTTGTATNGELIIAFYAAFSSAGITVQQVNGVTADRTLGADGNSCDSWASRFSATFTGAATATISSSHEWNVNCMAFKTQ